MDEIEVSQKITLFLEFSVLFSIASSRFADIFASIPNLKLGN